MASALDQELSCSICLELFKDPVTLPCMHSFCRECLLSMLIPKQSEDSTDAVCNIKQQDLDGDHSGRVIQCPECRYIAILDEGGVHKLPRNYTLANIVEKYGKPIEEKLTIPCDICDETPPAKACKHCKECQISYCIQCLFLHPKRGVLSKHNLIDPQCQEIQHSNDELEKICLICKCTVTKSDTHKEHSENVVSKETAVNKILSRYSASLNKKRKDVIDYMHSIEVSLQDMRKNYGKKFKDLMERKTSAEKKGMEHLGELQSSLDHISDMMLKVTNQTKTEDFDFMELFKMEESLGKLGNQFTQFSPVDDIGQNVQESNATSVIPDPASSPDKVADDVDTTSLTNKPTPVPASAFPNVATESNETSHSIHCEKIVIKDCVPVLSNSNLGAWLLVTWDTLNTDYLYELKFTCDTVEGGDIHITKGIQGSKHTQTLLRYDTRYIVTVSVMGAEQTESDGFQIKTQQQITCGHFQFSPVLTSEDIELNWTGEVLTSEDNKWPERDLHRIQGGAGTLLLHVYQSTQYWEIEVSYHLRGIDDDTNVAIMGICAKDKVDVIDAMEKNYFFYGIALGKSESGAPLIVYYCAGKSKMEDNMQPARLYRKKFGFYFDSNKFRLLVIDCEKNKVVLVTDRLKPKSYLPVCDMASECSDVEFELITGNRISSIPSCIMSCL